MRCSHCGFDNESGTYRCRKCGNSLLPPLPREIYTQAPSGNIHKTERRVRRLAFGSMCLLFGMMIGGIAMLLIVSAQAFVGIQSENTAAVIEEADEVTEGTVSSEVEGFIDIDITGDRLMLPASDITIGLPEYVDYQVNVDMANQKVVHVFDMDNGLRMEIFCYKMDYPFSKSAEEDYFMEEYDYDSLEGQEDQYFILESSATQVKATVIDRIHKNKYEILIFPSGVIEPELVEEAGTLLHDIVVGKSSLVPEGI